MRSVVCVVAALAVALLHCDVLRASDEGDDDPDSDATPDAAHALLFSGADIWRSGSFSHAGFLWAWHGLDQDGPVLRVLLNGGLYRFRAGATEITGRQAIAAAMPGWRWRGDGFELTAFAGIDVQDHRFTPDDRGNRVRGTRLGVRAGVDVWYEPFPDWMLTASVSASSVGMSYWARAAGGVRLFDAVWLGPELHAAGDDNYRQFRAGAHVTTLKLLGYEFSAGGGWVTDTDDRSGVYGRLGVMVRR